MNSRSKPDIVVRTDLLIEAIVHAGIVSAGGDGSDASRTLTCIVLNARR